MRKEIISESRLREIISEEATRFKKKLTLEAEKKKLLNRLNEMYMEEKALDEADAMPTTPTATPELAQEFMKAIGASTDQIAQIAAENPEEVQDPKGEAKDVASVASKVLTVAEQMMESYLGEGDNDLAKDNVAEVKIRMGKILQSAGIVGSLASVITAGVAWAIATGSFSGYSVADPMLYASIAGFLLSLIGVGAGRAKAKAGIMQAAAEYANDPKIKSYAATALDAIAKGDKNTAGKYVRGIDQLVSKLASEKGVMSNQVLTFQDQVKTLLGLPVTK